jgi:dihydroneopterin triphosphate diphosphatase
MPRIVSDSVDVYPFRRINGRAQFLVLLRRPEVVLGNTWHAIHAKVAEGESAFEAARRGVRQTTGVMATQLYSADLVSQFYDHYSDAISLAPVFAALLEGPGPVILAPDFSDFAWCDQEEAVVRLLSSSQRWAVRHIAHIIADGGPEAEYYRIE